MSVTSELGSRHDPEKNVIHNAESTHNERAWPNPRDNEIGEISEAEEQHYEEERGQQVPPISRILSRRSAVSFDLGPAPDGGITAWIQVLCTHLTIFTTFGFFTSFGVYQTYYENTLGIAPSTISWIGSIQVFLLFGIGAFTGRATDTGLFRPVYIAGAIFQLVGIFTMAQSTKLWQLFLSQGVCLGIANGLQFCPAMALVSTYFVKKRAFALGITSLGSCTGGVVFPIIVQQCLPRLGFPWTIRIIGFIMLVSNIITIALYRTRLPPRKTGPIVDWESFKEAQYSLYCAAMFFSFWGLYFAFFYIGSYGRNVLGVSYQQSINLLLVQICMGFVFRILPAYYADKIGRLNVLIPFAFGSGIMMFGWIGIHSLGSLYAFAVIYGSASAVIQALWPSVIGSLSQRPDLKKTGVRMGMAFTIVSFSAFTGPPLAGALIQQHDGNYTYANIWAGISFFVGGALLLATRFSLVGWDWGARIKFIFDNAPDILAGTTLESTWKFHYWINSIQRYYQQHNLVTYNNPIHAACMVHGDNVAAWPPLAESGYSPDINVPKSRHVCLPQLSRHINQYAQSYDGTEAEGVVNAVLRGRKPFISDNGYMGLAPAYICEPTGIAETDNEEKSTWVLAVVAGCCVPLLLREREDGTYRLVGTCFVQGWMDGEWIEEIMGAKTSSEFWEAIEDNSKLLVS